MSEEDIKILENIKDYMQDCINKGYHKFIYNDLGHDEKCIDVINAIETLIAENKELKEENEGLKTKLDTLIEKYKELKEEKEELKRENLEIRDWKYVIDSPIDLDKLKELDLIKIKGKEYISKSIYNELEKDKKAIINNYSKILGEFIPKSKVEELIEEVKKDENPSISSFQEYAQEYAIDKLQSLLGKE